MTTTHAHVVSVLDEPIAQGPRASAAELDGRVDEHVRARFLTPDDADWTNDGAANWVAGHVSGLAYSHAPGADHLVLHNRGDSELGVLSVPERPGTSDNVFTHLPAGSSVALPSADSHVLQSARIDRRPVLVGQILEGRDAHTGEPQMILDGPEVGEVDWDQRDPDGIFWRPGDVDFGVPTSPSFVFVDPLTHGVHHTRIDSEVTIHNRSDGPVAVLTVGADGPLDLLVAEPGESVPVPPGDQVCYVQAPRTDGSPTILGVMWLAGGVLMPSALPVPDRRDHLARNFLTPWSADWECGYNQQDHLDAEADGVTYQYRTGAETLTIRNTGDESIAVIYNLGSDRAVAEIAPRGRRVFPVRSDADTGQVFSVVGTRRGGTAGRAASVDSAGGFVPGASGRPGTPTNYGSVVVMLGTVVYSAIPKKNLYLAWSDRPWSDRRHRRHRRSQH
ncbi:hypothetical protein ACIGKQ_02980 [Gordonia sp. NPDC062954]|uniref:Uncharacterized protein n=1 Tax=Gordonia aquimaris TaxID=2984863 RepID=A0A9X3D2L6_9ACTN|nr:hypothetical protein [Gordonia aquimaris]MCX2963469.1 hypothetical protein [Gordonia aquimaris]